MVIHEESESPVEISIIREPAILEPKKYLMISNHVREINNYNEVKPTKQIATEQSVETGSDAVKRKKSTSKNPKKRKFDSTLLPSSEVTQISESDLSELRTVYQNCLDVISKIEFKYGHLLNVNRPGQSGTGQNSREYADLDSKEPCTCARNKKIVFDEDGTQYTREVPEKDHICPNVSHKIPIEKCNVETDAQDYFCALPDDLPTLSKMLRDPNLNLEHRNKVIQKFNIVKHEHCVDIKFNRPALVQAIKRDPYEVFAFKGVNWSSLPGYS